MLSGDVGDSRRPRTSDITQRHRYRAPGSSIGVAWTDRAIGSDAIVAAADEAMYEAKRTARGPVLALR